jgi:hypothetical protein
MASRPATPGIEVPIMSATARKAVTLTEVLIAIFLMGIGLMAILSLFPLGAAQMAQALQDQRCSEAATTADAVARTILKTTFDDDEASGGTGMVRFADMNPNNYMPNNPNSPYKNTQHQTMALPAPQSQQRFIPAMDDPQWGPPYFGTPGADKYSMAACGGPALPTGSMVPGSILPANGGLQPLPVSGPQAYATASYPVLVDPIGWRANAANPGNQWWVGTIPDTTTYNVPAWRIPRRPLYARDTTAKVSPQPWIPLGNSSLFGTQGTMSGGAMPIFKQFSLMDDMTFKAGAPYVPSNMVERQGRYTWAYMFRRAHNSDRTAIDITTICYSGRSIEVASPEITYPGSGVSPAVAAQVGGNLKELFLSYTNLPKPAVRRGTWVLDATLWDYDSKGKPTIPNPQGYFYRVVNVDDSTPGLLSLELQTPLLGGPGPNTPKATKFPRAIVVMDKVVEVFTKSDVARVAPQMPY